MTERISIPKLYAIAALGIVATAYTIWLVSPLHIPMSRTSARTVVINNLRAFDGAKRRWALEHGQAGSVVVGEQDLAPYLAHGSIRPVGGERYVLNPIGQAPEVELNHEMLGYAKGMRLRLGDEGDLVRSPIESLQPATP